MKLFSLFAAFAVLVAYNVHADSANNADLYLESVHCAAHGKLLDMAKMGTSSLVPPGGPMCAMSDRMREIMRQEAEKKAQEEKAKAESK